jgi:hypothetical protein
LEGLICISRGLNLAPRKVLKTFADALDFSYSGAVSKPWEAFSSIVGASFGFSHAFLEFQNTPRLPIFASSSSKLSPNSKFDHPTTNFFSSLHQQSSSFLSSYLLPSLTNYHPISGKHLACDVPQLSSDHLHSISVLVSSTPPSKG